MGVDGLKLFNVMPKSIRNLTGCSKASFKAQLDNFLKSVPDEPQITVYVIARRADSNSLLDMVRFA